jgi:hypothetical protein
LFVADIPSKPIHSAAWFDDAFTDKDSKPLLVPAKLREFSESVCRSFDLRGVCDPLYIANVAAVELGLGEGDSTFKGGVAGVSPADRASDLVAS